MMKIDYKNIALIALSAVSLFGLTSCTDLEVVEEDSIVAEAGERVPGDPDQLIGAMYDGLAVFGDQASIYSLMQHPSDELIPPTRGVDWSDNGVWRTLHSHDWSPTHDQVLNAWNACNSRVFQAEEILAANPNEAQQADANFLQAMFIWHVADLYGQVPFREFGQGVNDLPTVIPRAEAVSRAISQLEGAVANLPSLGPGENFRGSKAAAWALLARIYLNRAVYNADNPAGPYTHDDTDLRKVIEYADLVTGEGYETDSSYFSIWEAGTNKEPILSAAQNNGSNRWNMTLHYDQQPSGWNGFTTISELYNKFDENDPRFGDEPDLDGSEFAGIGTGFLEGQQFNANGDPIIDSRSNVPLQFTEDVRLNGANTAMGIRVIKYHPARASRYVIMRYGEVLMNKAEAHFRLGETDTALDIINQMRETRGGETLSSLDEETLLDERSRELYWEGLRRIDQVRFGTFAGPGNTWTEKGESDASRVLFPIPQLAVDSNPNLNQNPGY